jgi:hypothetical protein
MGSGFSSTGSGFRPSTISVTGFGSSRESGGGGWSAAEDFRLGFIEGLAVGVFPRDVFTVVWVVWSVEIGVSIRAGSVLFREKETDIRSSCKKGFACSKRQFFAA